MSKKKGIGGLSDLISLMSEDLSVNTEFQSIHPDDDFPHVYESQPGYEYFVAPRTNYKLQKLGPLKRKQYPIEWFYLYTIRLEDDGLEIFMNYYRTIPTNKVINLSTPLYNFIKHCDFFNIKSITFRYWSVFISEPGAKRNDEKKIKWETFTHLEKLNIYKDKRDEKFDPAYINNFPEEINPKPLEEYKHISKPEFVPGLLDLRHYQFKDYKDYFWFVRKLIKIGFSVKDSDGKVYNVDNIDEGSDYKISGQDAKDKEAERAAFNEKAYKYINGRFDELFLEQYKKMI